MTKSELVDKIAMQTGIEKFIVLSVVEGMMSNIKDAVAEGDNVYLRGFGSFITKTRKEKVARNIKKETSIVVPEHKVPAFKPSKEFTKIIK